MRLLQPTDRCHDRGGCLRNEHSLQLDTLFVAWDIEAQRGSNGLEQGFHAEPTLGRFGRGSDEALVPAQLAQRLPADPRDGVWQVRVRESHQNLLAVRRLRLRVELVLGYQQGARLL